MRIYYFTPYSCEGNLGKAYNESCSIVPLDTDWIVLMDGDVMFTSNSYGKQIEEVISQYHNKFDLFTCFATRIGSLAQRYDLDISEEKDLVKLHQMTLEAERNDYAKVSSVNIPIAGFFLLFQKKLWNKFKFPEGGLLHIDTSWSRHLLDRGMRIGKIKGLLAVHYYRLHSGREDKSHLI